MTAGVTDRNMDTGQYRTTSFATIAGILNFVF